MEAKQMVSRLFDSSGDLCLSFENQYKRATPIVYTLISCFFYVMVGVGVNMLKQFNSSQILFLRSIISLVISTFFMQQGGYNPYVPDKLTHKLLIWRCIFGGLGHFCYFRAFHLLNVGDAMTVFQTAPIWTAILAGIILKEPISAKLFISIGFSFVGIILVMQPPFLLNILGIISNSSTEEQSSRLLGFTFGFMFSIFVSITIIVIRKLSGKVHNSIVIHYVLISGYMLSGADITNNGEFNPEIFTTYNLSWVILIAVFNYIAQILYSRAIFIEKATRLAPFTYSQVVIGFLAEVVFFGKQISLLSVAGAALVIFGNIQVARQK